MPGLASTAALDVRTLHTAQQHADVVAGLCLISSLWNISTPVTTTCAAYQAYDFNGVGYLDQTALDTAVATVPRPVMKRLQRASGRDDPLRAQAWGSCCPCVHQLIDAGRFLGIARIGTAVILSAFNAEPLMIRMSSPGSCSCSGSRTPSHQFRLFVIHQVGLVHERTI